MDLTTPMGFDCSTCPVRDRQCADCVVTAFLALPTLRTTAPAPGAGDEPGLPLLPEERATVSRLVAAGLVAPQDAAGLRAEIVDDAAWATG